MAVSLRATVIGQTEPDGVVLQVEILEDQAVIHTEEWPTTYGWSTKSLEDKQEHVRRDGYIMLNRILAGRVSMQYTEESSAVLVDGEIPAVEVIE